MLTLVLSVIFVIVLLTVVVHFSINRCPDCHGKLVDNDYDENIGRVGYRLDNQPTLFD